MTKTIELNLIHFINPEAHMPDFEFIDVHTHLVRNIEEEEKYFLFPGRRRCDRYGTPERALEYMDRTGISKMAILNLIPRQKSKDCLKTNGERKRRKLPSRLPPSCGR